MQLVDVRESWAKMRKSLGNKRKQISAEQIDEITRLYGAFEENECVKVFPNEAFGFMRITVERPLRLRYQVTDQTLAALEADKKITALDGGLGQQVVDTVRSWDGTTFDGDGSALRKQVSACLKALGVHKKPLENAVIDALAVRDPRRPAGHRQERQPPAGIEPATRGRGNRCYIPRLLVVNDAHRAYRRPCRWNELEREGVELES